MGIGGTCVFRRPVSMDSVVRFVVETAGRGHREPQRWVGRGDGGWGDMRTECGVVGG